MKTGYARASTKDQNLDMPTDALKQAGLGKIHSEIVGGAITDRPIIAETLQKLRSGDILVIRRFGRPGRSLRHPVELVPTLMERGVRLLSLPDHVATTVALPLRSSPYSPNLSVISSGNGIIETAPICPY